MKSLLATLGLALICAMIFTWFSGDRQITETAEVWRLPALSEGNARRTPLSLPHTGEIVLSGPASDHVRLAFKASGYAHLGVLEINVLRGELYTARYGSGSKNKRKICKSKSKEPYTCRLQFHVGDKNETLLTLAAKSESAVISSLSFKPVTSKRQTTISPGEFFYAYVLLILIGPLLVWFRRFGNFETYALAALGLGWVAYSGIAGLAVSLCFVLASYSAISFLQKIEKRNTRALVAIIFGIALFIMFVKFLAPLIADSFANPGGFALALPLGISYFVIKIIDLLLKANAKALENFNLRDYLAFLFLPHTLPAGPIFTYETFLDSNIEGYSIIDFSAGLARMSVGFSKKLIGDAFVLPIVAGSMTRFLDNGLETSPKLVMTMLLANVVYVYLDFSGYSDIAIGAGRIGGRRIPENFKWPLIRGGILQFWQYWHMTLSNWVMRRVYFSAFLASRSTTLATLVAMMVIGLWHTPNMAWLTWAFHHALAMSAQSSIVRPMLKTVEARLSGWLAQAFSSAIYIFGVLFVWLWVALGHSFTLFSSYETALNAYYLGLQAVFGFLG